MNLYHKLKLGKPVFVSDISGVCFVRQTKNSFSEAGLFYLAFHGDSLANENDTVNIS